MTSIEESATRGISLKPILPDLLPAIFGQKRMPPGGGGSPSWHACDSASALRHSAEFVLILPAGERASGKPTIRSGAAKCQVRRGRG